jgi:spore maturation protein CgeB
MKVLILGMHRSGTSLVSGLLEQSGLYFGEKNDLIDANDENPYGFWERRDVRSINDEVLFGSYCDWDLLSNFELEGVSEEVKSKSIESIQSVATELDRHGNWGIKDPRLSVLYPLWSEVLGSPLYVFVVRDPLEVAASLYRRNGTPYSVGLALTELYLTHALNGLDMARCYFVYHRDFIKNAEDALSPLIDWLNASSASVPLDKPSKERVDGLLDRRLYRAQAGHNTGAEFSGNLKAIMQYLSKPVHDAPPFFTMSSEGYNFLSEYESELIKCRYFAEIHENKLLRESRDTYISAKETLKDRYVRLNKKQSSLTNFIKHYDHGFSLLQQGRGWRFYQFVANNLRALLKISSPSTTSQLMATQLEYKKWRKSERFRSLQSDCHVIFPAHSTSRIRFSLIVRMPDNWTKKGLEEASLRFNIRLDSEIIFVLDSNPATDTGFLSQLSQQERVLFILVDPECSSSIRQNIGVNHSQGQFLVFCDYRLVIQPAELERCEQVLLNDEVVAVGAKRINCDDGVEGGGYNFSFPALNVHRVDLTLYEAESVIGVAPQFMMIKSEELEQAGLFRPELDGGAEFVDLGVRLYQQKKHSASLLDLELRLHGDTSSHDDLVMRSTQHQLATTHNYVKRQVFNSVLMSDKLWSRHVYKIGFVVTEEGGSSKAGDYFTALELAEECRKLGWGVSFLPRDHAGKHCYDLSDLDAVVVLLDDYDVRKITHAKPNLLTIAWLRNWFQRWVKRAWINNYSLLLCSSEMARDMVAANTGRQVDLFRLASNSAVFNSSIVPASEYSCDYCFTGSYWTSPRDIEQFDPKNVAYNFSVFGEGWSSHSQFKDNYRGFVKYKDLPSVYASTKLLIDDANHVTKPWGSVNSRVFDALAAGVLVVTNGVIGAEEVFSGLLPTYSSSAELETIVNYYLDNEVERISLVEKLQSEVREKHSYKVRAKYLQSILCKHIAGGKISVAIKVAVPDIKQAKQWGDFHFGLALKNSLKSLGYSVRLDILPDWYVNTEKTDDVVIVIRGLSKYTPRADQLNLMWQISHPEKTDDDEYNTYDHVFIASQSHVNTLQERLEVDVSLLLQCTDPDSFYVDASIERNDGVLFVGNSRQQLRPIVRDAISANISPRVYGADWEGIIGQQFIAGTHINNDELRKYYSTCGVLLNDHWDSMRETGYISNRLFDAAACGSVIISDEVEGVGNLFSNLIYQYKPGKSDLEAIVSSALAERELRGDERLQLAKEVTENHSFTARAKVISELIMNFF